MNPPHRGKLILLPSNRVWRTYPGGRTLDEIACARTGAAGGATTVATGGAPPVSAPADTHFAEDWIASTTRAVNPGREHLVEGVSQVQVGHDPRRRDFAELLASDPEYFLGAAHVAKYGPQPQLLVKFLDSGTRLHFQVHPTREFARRVLGAPSGKTEAYYVLGVRNVRSSLRPAPGTSAAAFRRKVEVHAARESLQPVGAASVHLGESQRSAPVPERTGYVYVGFQRPPTPAQLRDYIATQNIAAIEACFDPVPVKPGDTFIIPGGTPHALGAGVFMVEIQEPSDLVVRFEFERAGYVLPEPARFMGRDLDFALTVFNLAPLSAGDLESRVRCHPRRARDFAPQAWREELIGPAQTDCFRVARTHVGGPLLKDENSASIAIVTAGSVMAEVGGETHQLQTYDKVFLPAGLGAVALTPVGGTAELLECFPPG